jgi:hypothetical protein
MIELVSIQFAHTPSSSLNTAAIAVRKNGTTPASVPEWIPGRTATDSLAVYAISDTAIHPITIRVRLRATDLQVTSVFIRAQTSIPSDQQRRGCNAIVGLFTGRSVNPDDINVTILGDVAEQVVSFGADGLSAEMEFTVTAPREAVDYIASGKTTWMWQFRTLDTVSWTTFTQTEHTIFTILTHPTDPWVISAPAEDATHSLLWTDLLQHACWWARGQRTPEAAAGTITEQLYARGSMNILKYEQHYGSPSFANMDTHQFDLQGFLNVIASTPATPITVNCDDCACALVSFANSVGCDLWVAIIGNNDDQIYINPIRVIGVGEWNEVIPDQVDPLQGAFFFYHSAAMTGNATWEDNVYDGMLQLNGNRIPSREPYTPLLAKNLPFGANGNSDSEGDPPFYRYHFAKPDTQSQTVCSPHTDLKYRPIVS